jgi:hypothetical protein
MKVTLKSGCNHSFTRRYCPQAIEEYGKWGFTFDAQGMSIPAVKEMTIDEITTLVKYFTHRETKYDLTGDNLQYSPNAPYYPGCCMIQVTKFLEGPGSRYWGREKDEVEYYMNHEEKIYGPQEDMWYITISDEDKELTLEEYAIHSPKSAVGTRPNTFHQAIAPPTPPISPPRSWIMSILGIMSEENIVRLASIVIAAFPEVSMWQTSNIFASTPGSPIQPWTHNVSPPRNTIWVTENESSAYYNHF